MGGYCFSDLMVCQRLVDNSGLIELGNVVPMPRIPPRRQLEFATLSRTFELFFVKSRPIVTLPIFKNVIDNPRRSATNEESQLGATLVAENLHLP